MEDVKRRRAPLIITISIMLFIFIQSALPADMSKMESGMIVGILMKVLHLDAETMSFAVRKLAHFTEYLFLGLSLFMTVREYYRSGNLFRTAIISWGAGTLYAATDEVHQYFVPGRSCEIRDMLIDSCGVAAGVLIMAAIRSRRTKT